VYRDTAIDEALHEGVGTAEQFVVVGDEADESLQMVELFFLFGHSKSRFWLFGGKDSDFK